MKTNVRKQFARLALASTATFLPALLGVGAWVQESRGQDAQSQSSAQAARDQKNEKIEAAKGKIQGARDSAQEARQDFRGTAREDRRDIRDARESAGDKIGDTRREARGEVRDARQEAGSTIRDDRHTTRDARETARDTVRDDRQQIREARRDAREARREFIAERLRSGDIGLFFRRLADRLQISDVAGTGAIAQSGLKEGDEIVSVNGKPVHSEREFVDTMFADHETNKPAQVVINRKGQQQTLSINTKPFVEEHLNSDHQLQDFGLVLDQNDPNHVKVQTVMPRSPAFYGGVKSGDVITRFNGQRVNAVKDLIQTIAGLTSNSTSVEVNRNGGSRSLDIEVPGTQQDEARTALKPTLPSTAPPATQPQGSRAPQFQPQPQQPNLPRQ
jgi:C-terminal processing protease CtpA/Prc